MSTHSTGYSGTPLPKKLGIRPGHRVLLVNVPDSIVLEPALLDDVDVARSTDLTIPVGPYDVILALCRDAATMFGCFPALKACLQPSSALWLGWLKQASGGPTDLTEDGVRSHGLRYGLVDVKICAVDAQWSGLKFVYRIVDRPR